MRNKKTKLIIGLVFLLTVAGLSGDGRADKFPVNEDSSTSNISDSPSNEEIAFAQRTSDLMLNELLAALFQEFNETTPNNVEEGKQAISLIFHNLNRDMRLIGSSAPLLGGFNDLPSDSFEQQSLALALQGEANTSVERMGNRWFYRRSIALSNAFHPACVLCHTNFTPEFFQQTNNPGQWVGALALRVPIKTD
jgi:hypothetical protein